MDPVSSMPTQIDSDETYQDDSKLAVGSEEESHIVKPSFADG